jgi:hypothetical protein
LVDIGGSALPRSLEPGDLVLRRMYRGAHVIWVQACHVVSDDDRGLLLWLPAGAGFAHRPQPAELGERSPRRIDELGSLPVLVETWRDTSVLILVPPDEPYSVWWFFNGSQFTHWYVNLELPSQRWSRDGLVGVDSFDHALDILIDPDLRWRWKDEDELAERIDLPGYWSAEQAQEIRGDGDRVVEAVKAGAFPFDGTWCDFRPNPAWPLPELPATGWDTPPVWTPSARA